MLGLAHFRLVLVVSANGMRVAFFGYGAGVYKLSSVAADGTELTTLITTTTQTVAYAFTPDSTTLIVSSREGSDRPNLGQGRDLYSVSLSGGPVTKVSALPMAFNTVEDYQYTRDGLLLYRADQEREDALDLFKGERTLVFGLFPAGAALAAGEHLATIAITISDDERATQYIFLPLLKR